MGTAAVIAGLVWFLMGFVTSEGTFGTFSGSPFPIALVLMVYGLAGGPILVVAGGILRAVSERRQTAGEWVGWASIGGGLGWGILTFGYLGWVSSPEVTIMALVSALALVAVGVGALSWERRSIQRAGVP